MTNITYFGHCCYLLSLSSERKILIDPFQNPSPPFLWFETELKNIETDIVLITHPHYDHDNVYAVRGNQSIIRDPLTADFGDFRLNGIQGKHAKHYGKEFGRKNTVFVIETEGVKICHFGDNRPDLSDGQLKQIGAIDILMIPIDDSGHILEFEEANSLIKLLNPRIVFPMHYFINGITSIESGLKGLEGWFDSTFFLKRTINDSQIKISTGTIPNQTEIWFFSETKSNKANSADTKSRYDIYSL